ncbi:signal recognition particle 9 kDa protein-like [Sycon ciliatum]|uniref:signal recognition particle 9 kDa protein-like n=1 Tax=Sycon ciliatum TaxID=27933 RepID=UPI0020A8A0BD
MPYLVSWEVFAREAERLYLENPGKARFVVKYRHKDGELVIKITDDVVCLKYRTDQSQDVKKLEKLSNSLMRHMVGKSS